MQYQISFLSPNGHARCLAEAISKILPADTAVMDLEEECEVYAETQLIGFEMNEVSIRAVPYRIMELLNKLEHHNVILFVTSPFRTNSHVKDLMEHRIEPFLPETCHYLGLYLCTGQASEALLNSLRFHAEKNPEDKQAENALRRCEESIGHPDEEEITKACRFVAEILRIE